MLRTAELNVGFTKVRAPIGGRVSRTALTKGNMVQSGDQSGGTLLTTIVSVDPIYALFDIDERTLIRLRKCFTVTSQLVFVLLCLFSRLVAQCSVAIWAGKSANMCIENMN